MLLIFVKIPWHEYIDACGWVASGEGFKCYLEIGISFDIVEFAGLDE